MHEKFLEYLCCPLTHSPLELKAAERNAQGMIQTGALLNSTGQSYPILRGIPRFVKKENYASSFGYEWNHWPRVQFEDENVGKPMQGHTTKMWKDITLADENNISGKTIVEFGCGPGRFLDIVRRFGGKAVGIDMSLAVEAARTNFKDDPDVLIVQGDLFNPPFPTGVFDAGYTVGVLHHTPDPQKGLQSLVSTIRPGGWAACVVYPKGGFYDFPSLRRARKLFNGLKPFFGFYPALLYTYLSAYILAPCFNKYRYRPGYALKIEYLEKNWLPVMGNLADMRWRILDTFDSITPQIATTHTEGDVQGWMRSAGCSSVQMANWGNTSAVGIRD